MKRVAHLLKINTLIIAIDMKRIVILLFLFATVSIKAQTDVFPDYSISDYCIAVDFSADSAKFYVNDSANKMCRDVFFYDIDEGFIDLFICPTTI